MTDKEKDSLNLIFTDWEQRIKGCCTWLNSPNPELREYYRGFRAGLEHARADITKGLLMSSLQVGELLYGFCSGYFGSRSYSTKRIEAVRADWVLARDEQGDICLAIDDAGMGAEKFHAMLREVSNERQGCETQERETTL